MNRIYQFKLSFLILTIAIIALSTTVYAINNTDTTKLSKEPIEKSSEVLTEQFTTEFGKKPDEIKQLKTEHKEWKNVYMELIKEKRQHKNLTKAVKEQLLNDGYQSKDLNKAEEFAAFSDKAAIEILQLRGKKPNYTIRVETDKDGVQKSIVTDHTAELWDPVIARLGIDLKQVSEKLGVLPEDIAKMSKQGISPREVYEISLLSIGFTKDYTEVWNDFAKGATLEELQVKYIREVKGIVPVAEPIEVDSKTRREQIIKKAYQLTDDELTFFNQSGITDYTDMGQAKHLATKHKLTLQNVLDIRKKKQDWYQVSTELEGEQL